MKIKGTHTYIGADNKQEPVRKDIELDVLGFNNLNLTGKNIDEFYVALYFNNAEDVVTTGEVGELADYKFNNVSAFYNGYANGPDHIREIEIRLEDTDNYYNRNIITAKVSTMNGATEEFVNQLWNELDSIVEVETGYSIDDNLGAEKEKADQRRAQAEEDELKIDGDYPQDVIDEAQKIFDTCKLEGADIHIDTDGVSVLVKDTVNNIGFWFDIFPSREGDLEGDWNKYIFHNNFQDQVENALQNNGRFFEAVFEVAENYAMEKEAIKWNDETNKYEFKTESKKVNKKENKKGIGRYLKEDFYDGDGDYDEADWEEEAMGEEREDVEEYIISFEPGELYDQYGGEFITENDWEADDLFEDLKEEHKLDQVDQYIRKVWEWDRVNEEYYETDVEVYFNAGDELEYYDESKKTEDLSVEEENKLADDIEKYLTDNQLYPVDVFAADTRVMVELHWGDWKHDHLRCDSLMKAKGYGLVEEEVTEEDGSDCYSAIRHYEPEGKFDNVDIQESKKTEGYSLGDDKESFDVYKHTADFLNKVGKALEDLGWKFNKEKGKFEKEDITIDMEAIQDNVNDLYIGSNKLKLSKFVDDFSGYEDIGEDTGIIYYVSTKAGDYEARQLASKINGCEKLEENKEMKTEKDHFNKAELTAVKNSIDTALDDLQLTSTGTTGDYEDKALRDDLRNVGNFVGRYITRMGESKKVTEAVENLKIGDVVIATPFDDDLYSSIYTDSEGKYTGRAAGVIYDLYNGKCDIVNVGIVDLYLDENNNYTGKYKFDKNFEHNYYTTLKGVPIKSRKVELVKNNDLKNDILYRYDIVMNSKSAPKEVLKFQQTTDSRYDKDAYMLLQKRLKELENKLNIKGVKFDYTEPSWVPCDGYDQWVSNCTVKKTAKNVTWENIYEIVNSIKAVPYKLVVESKKVTEVKSTNKKLDYKLDGFKGVNIIVVDKKNNIDTEEYMNFDSMEFGIDEYEFEDDMVDGIKEILTDIYEYTDDYYDDRFTKDEITEMAEDITQDVLQLYDDLPDELIDFENGIANLNTVKSTLGKSEKTEAKPEEADKEIWEKVEHIVDAADNELGPDQSNEYQYDEHIKFVIYRDFEYEDIFEVYTYVDGEVQEDLDTGDVHLEDLDATLVDIVKKLQDKTTKVEESSFADEQLIKDKIVKKYDELKKNETDNNKLYNQLSNYAYKDLHFYNEAIDYFIRDLVGIIKVINKKTEAVDNENKVLVYQIADVEHCDYAFMDYAFAKEMGIDLKDYKKTAEVQVNTDLDGDVNSILELVFSYGNTNQEYYQENPEARSISVSDILEYNGKKYYVDSFGFEEVVGIQEDSKEVKTEAEDMTAVKDNIEKAKEDTESTEQEIEQVKGSLEVLKTDEEEAIAGYDTFVDNSAKVVDDELADAIDDEMQEIIQDEKDHIEKLDTIKSTLGENKKTEASVTKFQTLTVDKDGNEMLLKDVSYNNACSWLEKELAKAGSKVVDTETNGNKTIIKADNKTKFEYDEEKGTLKRLEETKSDNIPWEDADNVLELLYGNTVYATCTKQEYANNPDKYKQEVVRSVMKYENTDKSEDEIFNSITVRPESRDVKTESKEDTKYIVCSYYDEKLHGLEDDLYTNEWDDVEEFAHRKLMQGNIIEIENTKTGKSKRINPDEYNKEFDGEFIVRQEELDEDKKITEAEDLKAKAEAVKEKVEKAKADIGLKQAEEMVDTENELTEGIKKEIIQYAKQQGLDVEKLQKQGELNSVAEALDNIIGEMVSKSANEFMDTTGKNIEWDFEVKDNNINVIWNEV